MSSSILNLPTPRVFAPLLQPARYKGAHGGRGSGKSHFFAELMVERCVERSSTRAVCIREIQKSLDQSVKQLIEDKIDTLGVGPYFDILDTEIHVLDDAGERAGLILFQGMQNHTAETIKSLEGYDVAWVEEAQALSKTSLKLLRPTIRKPGSELWFTWNPRKDDDPVDKLLRAPSPPPRSIVVEANYTDNPWFPVDLREEMEFDRVNNADDFGHVWLGDYQKIAGAVIFRDRIFFETFEEPHDARPFYGADWGFANDPTALIRSYERDDCLFITHEAFGYGVEIDETPALFDSVPGSRLWPIKADSARPETISYLRRREFNIAAAEKWPGSVEDGIAHLKAFKRIVVHPRCTNLAKEFRLYSYKVDRVTGDILPIIVDKHNHGIDALRYSLDGYIQRRGGLGIWAKLAG